MIIILFIGLIGSFALFLAILWFGLSFLKNKLGFNSPSASPVLFPMDPKDEWGLVGVFSLFLAIQYGFALLFLVPESVRSVFYSGPQNILVVILSQIFLSTVSSAGAVNWLVAVFFGWLILKKLSNITFENAKVAFKFGLTTGWRLYKKVALILIGVIILVSAFNLMIGHPEYLIFCLIGIGLVPLLPLPVLGGAIFCCLYPLLAEKVKKMKTENKQN